MRRRGDGSLAFDDAVGEVSGTFVTGRRPGDPPGLLIYVMVADGRAALDAVVAGGGMIVREIDPDAGEGTGRRPGRSPLGDPQTAHRVAPTPQRGPGNPTRVSQ